MISDIKFPELKTIMYHIVKGLAHKVYLSRDTNRGRNTYPDSAVLRHGLNELYVYAMTHQCVDSKGKVLAPANETEAIVEFFSRPVSEWMAAWPQNIIAKAQNDYLWDWESLVSIGYHNTYILTDFCEELAEAHKMRVVETELPQAVFYRKLMTLTQEEYEEVRKFVIQKENRVIKRYDLGGQVREMGVRFGKLSDINDIFKIAYEPWESLVEKIVLCERCGWTVEYTTDGRGKCQNDRCIRATNTFNRVKKIDASPQSYYRLKKGIIRYVSDPGELELDIERECLKLGIETQMWPDMDRYDLTLTFKDGEKWAVDAKDYAKAFLLKEKIEEDGEAIPIGDWERGFIVIPDERVEKSYCRTVNRGIKAIGQDNKVECVGLKTFMQKVKAKVEEGKRL
ncbi:hypothetical protein AAC978_07715 [Desulfitobacterium sp. THU1]|uniref:restriction endonuclease-related protein n=1 Tax=Desulfitobacterium sp. THU1 TaxID=3138072 RepID=UPI00311DA701